MPVANRITPILSLRKGAYVFALVICGSILGLGVLARFSAGSVVDDAYMFVRYADHVLSDGRLAWNPGGEATYGPTSLLYLAVVACMRTFATENAAFTAALSSLTAGLCFLGLLFGLIWRYADVTRTGKRLLILAAFFAIAASAHDVASHFVSGMDTTFALAFLTAYIWIGKSNERTWSWSGGLWMGLWGGLAFFARPDLLIYSFLVPASMVVFGSDSTRVRHGLWILGLTAAVAGGQAWFASACFNSPLPLSFYAKGLTLYSSYFVEQYRLVPYVEGLSYLASYWYLFLIIGSDLAFNFRAWRFRVSAVEKGLLVATCMFLVYYLFFVLQIMPSPQRFYYPTLPALLFLATQGAVRLVERIPETVRREFSAAASPVYVFMVFLMLGCLLPSALTVSRGVGSRVYRGNLLNFDIYANYRERLSAYWFRLDVFSRLPDDLVIATTEVGCPAAMNPDKQIVDLTGLNETDFAHEGFSADRLFETYRPDLIYMPNPHYRGMIAQIANHPHFVENYAHFPASALGAAMGIALRRESGHYPQMHDIISGRTRHEEN
ncbi:MAG: hypothetical protein OXR72_06490 [Gemmatimonadota bacterium]|nr:hypothetical protein [Gemmatimonadota bacterium]